jgi:TatA/E family protein of Tat protein translocase
MAGLGWQELSIVLIIVLVIFGAGKLPEVAKSLGRGVKELKEESTAPVGAQALPAEAVQETGGTKPAAPV